MGVASTDKGAWQPEFHRLLYEEPDDAWTLIVATVDAGSAVDDLGRLGCGPLEDILRVWGGRFNDELIESARSDPRWGYAASMLRDTPGAQEASDAAAASWPDATELRRAAQDALDQSRQPSS